MSRASAARIMQEVNQHQVKQLLEWNELEYGRFQMETGLEYLNKMLGSDDFGVSFLSKNSAFWKWWKNHWDKRDEQFISQANQLDLGERLELYGLIHDTKRFRFYPHTSIWESIKVKVEEKEAVR